MTKPARVRRRQSVDVRIPNIVVFVRTPLGELDPALVAKGLHERLTLLTYLFCPEHEEPPNDVLKRTRIESLGDDSLTIRWRPARSRFPLRVDLVKGRRLRSRTIDRLAALQRGVDSGDYSDAQTRRVRNALAQAAECVGFFLSPVDRRGMGWPVAIAAAAKLAYVGDGVIGTNDSGWMVPDGNEVSWILQPISMPMPNGPAIAGKSKPT
jgi:hypothetical protein